VNSRRLAQLVIAGAIVLAAGLSAAASGDNRPASSSTVVAEVGNKHITLDELNREGSTDLAKARTKLLAARYQYYLAQHQVLEKLIDQAVLGQQARKEGVSVEELLRRHIKQKIKDPSDEALRVYYLGLQTDQPYEAVRPKIIDHIRKLEEHKLVGKYVDTLRAKDSIRIALQPPHEQVAVGATPAIGSPNAPVTVIEFADYQCPYCRGMEPSVTKLREQFKGRIRYAYRDFPLPMHPYAQKAAEATRCAANQGKFWPYHDRLFVGDGNQLDVPDLKTIARELKLDTKQFDECLDSGKEKSAVEADATQGKELGVTGTPTFFINGYLISGSVSYDSLREMVQQQLLAARGEGSKRASADPHPRAAEASACDPHHRAGATRASSAQGKMCRPG
jgi:protein-disulfide isomerase